MDIDVKIGDEELRVHLISNSSIGTVISVWKRAQFGNGGTYTYFDDLLYQRVGSDPDHSLFDHLPGGSEERIAKVAEAYNARYGVAYQAIRAAYKLPDETSDWTLYLAHANATPYLREGEYHAGIAAPIPPTWCKDCEYTGWLNGKRMSLTPCPACGGVGWRPASAPPVEPPRVEPSEVVAAAEPLTQRIERVKAFLDDADPEEALERLQAMKAEIPAGAARDYRKAMEEVEFGDPYVAGVSRLNLVLLHIEQAGRAA